MKRCPCGTGRSLEDCCGPVLSGMPAITPEVLMRSRYSAFVLCDIDHLERTHAPETRGNFNRAEAERFASEVEWLGLEIISSSESNDTGMVEFHARFCQNGHESGQHELSRFKRQDGCWLYVDGDVSAKQLPRRVVKVGRNDPCACGSGKKYKRCCGITTH